MAGNWGAILAGLAGGAGSLGQSMTENADKAELRKRQAIADAIAMLAAKDKYGLSALAEGVSDKDALNQGAISQLNQTKPSIQMAGGGSSMMPRIADGPSYTEQRDEQTEYGPQSIETIGANRFLRDPSQGSEARTERRTTRLEEKKSQEAIRREALKSVRDYDEQRRLKELEASLKPKAPVFGTETFDDGVYAFDRTTGQRGARLGAAPKKEMTAGQAALQGSREQRQESSLRKDFDANALVKKAYGVAGAVGDARTALAENGPVGDLMALYAMVKMFDPLSVVREGEIKLAQGANSLPDKIRLLYENTARGRKITPYYRKQMESLVDEMVGQNRKLIAPVQSRFGASARRFGVDSSAVAPDPFEGLGTTPNREQNRNYLRGKP
jgi:hypothetical protein